MFICFGVNKTGVEEGPDEGGSVGIQEGSPLKELLGRWPFHSEWVVRPVLAVGGKGIYNNGIWVFLRYDIAYVEQIEPAKDEAHGHEWEHTTLLSLNCEGLKT